MCFRITMKTIVQLIFINLIIGGTILAADLDEVKRNALEKMKHGMDELRGIINETLLMLPIKEDNLKLIVKHERERGDGLLDSTNFEIHKMAVTGLMMRNLMEKPKDVIECIEHAETEARKETDRYYSEKFLVLVAKFERDADKIQRNGVEKWFEEYNTAVITFNEIYTRVVVDVENGNDVEDVAATLENFERLLREMISTVTKVNGQLNDIQYQLLQILDNFAVNIRITLRQRVDVTTGQIRNCFDSTMQSPIDKSFFPLWDKLNVSGDSSGETSSENVIQE